jgi:hypothetical protein
MECEEEFRGGGATPRRSSPERNRQRALGMELQEPFAGERRGGGNARDGSAPTEVRVVLVDHQIGTLPPLAGRGREGSRTTLHFLPCIQSSSSPRARFQERCCLAFQFLQSTGPPSPNPRSPAPQFRELHTDEVDVIAFLVRQAYTPSLVCVLATRRERGTPHLPSGPRSGG